MVNVLSAYLRTPRIQIAALIYFLIAGALTRIPLFNYLGYEFSAAMSIPAAMISGILTILFMREHRAKPLTRRTWMLVLTDYLLVNTLLLLIPLAVITLNAFVVKNCAYGTGLLYYLLITECAMIFSVALALVTGILFRKSIFIFCLIVTAILSHILLITYTQPQLFAYNFILGFFPGITYDETLSDINQIVLYREFTIIAALMLMTLFIILTGSFLSSDTLLSNLRKTREQFRSDITLWSIVIFCGLILGIGHIFRADLGFEYSEEEIQKALGRRSESEHFVIYYAESDHSADEMRVVKAECEFHYRIVSEYLKLTEPRRKKIAVYLYPDTKWKHRFIGTTNTNIAKPWKREVHLTTGTFRSTFRHELVHAAAAEFGFPLIDASTRMGLNEGLAVATEWDEGLFTPHEYSAALLRLDGLNQTERLFSFTGFALQSSSYAYLVSGSFVRYLIERFGMERFRKVFSNGNFVAAFGEPIEGLLKSWKAFLKGVDSGPLPEETVRVLFFQPSIFYKTCAREVASQNQRGAEALREKDYHEAETEFTRAFENAQTAGALRGLLQSLIAQNRPQEIKARLADLPEHSPLRNNPGIRILEADADYLLGLTDSAEKGYRSILTMNLSESFNEVSLLRIQFISDKIDSKVFQMLMYSSTSDSVRITLIDSLFVDTVRPISISYLRGLLMNAKTKGRAELFTMLSRTKSNIQYFVSMRAADQLFRERSFEEAKVIYWQMKNIVPTAALSERVEERIALCDFVMMELQ